MTHARRWRMVLARLPLRLLLAALLAGSAPGADPPAVAGVDAALARDVESSAVQAAAVRERLREVQAWICAAEALRRELEGAMRAAERKEEEAHPVLVEALARWRPELAGRLNSPGSTAFLVEGIHPRVARLTRMERSLLPLASLALRDTSATLHALQERGFPERIDRLLAAEGPLEKALASSATILEGGLSRETVLIRLETALEPSLLTAAADVESALEALSPDGRTSDRRPRVELGSAAARLETPLRSLRSSIRALSASIERLSVVESTAETRLLALEVASRLPDLADQPLVATRPPCFLEGTLFRAGPRLFILFAGGVCHVYHASLEELRALCRWTRAARGDVKPEWIAERCRREDAPVSDRAAALGTVADSCLEVLCRPADLLESYLRCAHFGEPDRIEEALRVLTRLRSLDREGVLARLLVDPDRAGAELLAYRELFASHALVEIEPRLGAASEQAPSGLWARPAGGEMVTLSRRGERLAALVSVRPGETRCVLVGGEMDGRPLRQAVLRLPRTPARISAEYAMELQPARIATDARGESWAEFIDRLLEENRFGDDHGASQKAEG